MYKIKTLNAIAIAGLKQFPQSLYDIGPDVVDPDVILVRSHPMHQMRLPSSIKAIGRAGAGVNNIPVAELTRVGIPVFNTPGANANAVKELVIAGMLLGSRHLCQAFAYVQGLQGDDATIHHEIEAHKKQFVGCELMGRTLGVIGLGSIGVKVANAAIHLGMQVIGFDPTITVHRAWELSSSVQQAHDLQELLAQSDFISVHVPLTEATKHMLGRDQLSHVQPHAILLNFARDALVDANALLSLLNEKKLKAYVTDFPEAALKGHPRAICLPHLGASTNEAEDNCAVMIAKQLRDFLEFGSIVNAVNFPTMKAPPIQAGIRLAIVNANVPNMVAQISSNLAAAGLNIVSLHNKSLDTIAYTLVDVDHDISDDTMRRIQQIGGVIQARLITGTVE